MSPEPRRDFPVPVPVDLTAAQGEVREESAVNLSPGGVCLHVRTPLAEGDRVHLRLEVPPEGPLLEAPGQVVWTSRDTASDGDPDDASGHWEVGVRLETEALSEEVRRRVRDWASQPTGRRR